MVARIVKMFVWNVSIVIKSFKMVTKMLETDVMRVVWK